jgi:hypothetical protein
MHGKVDVNLHLFLNFVLNRSDWSASCSDRFISAVKGSIYKSNRRHGSLIIRDGLEAPEKRKNLFSVPGIDTDVLGCPVQI